MFKKKLLTIIFLTALICIFSDSKAESTSRSSDPSLTTYTLPNFTVRDQKVANIRPASTYQTIVSNLDFDPRMDFQSRNIAEAQGDINIRGGIFEGTGIQIGAATLIDPQTGHYSTELPIAPEMLSLPNVLTGSENAFYGFNSTAGTISYEWSEMVTGGSLTLGGGENQLKFDRIYQAIVQPIISSNQWRIGYEAEFSQSKSDGTVAFSDHEFNRLSSRIQLIGIGSQTDLFAGYQSKFFGQYGMYTGDQYILYNPYETENIKTRLFILNHKQEYSTQSQFEATAYYRRNSDHYIFNRFGPPSDKFLHETQVYSFAVNGKHIFDAQLALNYNFQLTADEIESNSLEAGKFNSRTYTKFSLLPELLYILNGNEKLLIKSGLSYDDTNQNTSQISPIAEISLLREHLENRRERIYISYAETTQLAGYGAIGGKEGEGLFRSNHDLLRETSNNLEIGYNINGKKWRLDSALFRRWDDNLVDWTYSGVGARASENVDIKTLGLEIILARKWNHIEAICSYAYLEKSEDYKNPDVIGSFYALNFPKQRGTLGLIYTPNSFYKIRLDNEWREQELNTLRKGGKNALFSYVSISYFPIETNEFEVFLTYDKPWNENFQEIPGTPGRGDQLALGVNLKW